MRRLMVKPEAAARRASGGLGYTKGGGHSVLLGAGETELGRQLAPGVHDGADLVQDGVGALGFDAEVFGDGADEVQLLGVVGLGDIESEAFAQGDGVHVVGGGQYPATVFE